MEDSDECVGNQLSTTSERRTHGPNQPTPSDGDRVTSSPTHSPVTPPSTSMSQPSPSPSTGPPMPVDSRSSEQLIASGGAHTPSPSQSPMVHEPSTHPPISLASPSTSSNQHSWMEKTCPPVLVLPTLTSPLRSQELADSDLPMLMTVLGNAAHCTEQLGYQIGLAPDLVRTLEREANGDLVSFLSKVLLVRLRILPALTVQELADALSKPPIGNETLAHNLQQCVSKQPVHVEPAMSAPSLSSAMKHFSDFLDAVYQNDLILQGSKGDPIPGNKYIKLAVIKKEEVTQADADEFTKATLHGGIDQIMKRKEEIELTEIFKPVKSQGDVKFVLAEGAPGIGKSTMAWELCRSRHKLQGSKGFSAVLYLPLREKEVQEAKSLEDLISFIYQVKPNFQQLIVEEIESNQGEGLLLVLDGFDEVPVHLRNMFFLARIIQGKLLPKATVLVTSRPSARADLLKLRKPHKHIEVLGFTSDMIEQYATSVFGTNQLLADFITYISINPLIKGMMYVPLNSAIVMDIYQETRKVGRPIPQTLTQLYSELVLTRMWRYLKETGDPSADSIPDDLIDIAQKHPGTYKHLLELAKIAFDGTVKQEVIFDDLPAGCSTLGLMTVSRHPSRRDRVLSRHFFFHLTVQEFLAAFYVSQLPGSEQRQVIAQYSDQQSRSLSRRLFTYMDIVWRFLAGLMGLRDIGVWSVIFGDEDSDDEQRKLVGPFLVQCLYEAQEKLNWDDVLRTPNVTYSGESLPFDCFAVGYCVASSRRIWGVSFNLLGPELLEMLVLGLRSQGQVCGSIDGLDLSGNSIGLTGITHLREMPKVILQQLSCLNVRQCELDGTALDLLSTIIPTMTSLEHFDISNNQAAGGLVKIFQALANLKSLSYLNIVSTPIGGYAALSNLIQLTGHLKKLRIGGFAKIEPNCLEQLLKAAFSSSSLAHLELVWIRLISSSLAPLKANQNIVQLQWNPDPDAPDPNTDICRLAKVLSVNTKLENLSIGESINGGVAYGSSCTVNQRAAKALSDALKANRSLKVLTLGLTGRISHNEVCTIVDALQYNQTLEVLKLPHGFEVFLLKQDYRIRVATW